MTATLERTVLDSKGHAYEVHDDWGRLPNGWSYKEVAAVAVDANDNVYVFNRGKHPVIIFDRDGNFLSSWGEDMFRGPAHGMTIAADGSIYTTEEHGHTVKKFTPDGTLLMTLGEQGKPAPRHSGAPFSGCTDVALCPKTGAIYVSDGYGNSRVHKFSGTGEYLFSWGESGNEPGQFNIPHAIATDRQGLVYVADRHNQRVQIFDENGKYVTQWTNMGLPCALYIDTRKGEQLCYIGELASSIIFNREAGGLGPRVSVYDLEGRLIAKLGSKGMGEAPDEFIAPHGISTDSVGDIYVAEASWGPYGKLQRPPREVRSLRKLVKLR